MTNYNQQPNYPYRHDGPGGPWPQWHSNPPTPEEGGIPMLGRIENGVWQPLPSHLQPSIPSSANARPLALTANPNSEAPENPRITAANNHIDSQSEAEQPSQPTHSTTVIEKRFVRSWKQRVVRGVGILATGAVFGGAAGVWATNKYHGLINQVPVVRSVLEGTGGLPKETEIKAEIGTKDIVIAYLSVNAPGEATLESTISTPKITDIGAITEALIGGKPFPTHDFAFTDSAKINPHLEEENGVRLAYALDAQKLHVDAVKDTSGDLRDVVVTVSNSTVKALALQNNETNGRHAKSQAETGLAVGRTAFNNGSKTALDAYRIALDTARNSIPDFLKTPAIDKFLEDEDKKLQSFVDAEAAKNNILHNAAQISQTRIAEAMAMQKFSELPEVKGLVTQLVQQEAAMRLGTEFQTWVDPSSIEVRFTNNDGGTNQIVFAPDAKKQQDTDKKLQDSLKALDSPMYTGGLTLDIYTPTPEELAKIQTTFELVNVAQEKSDISIVEEPVR